MLVIPASFQWSSQDGSRYKTLVVKTDEQLEMARGVVMEKERLAGKE